jgi:hypothetical protein
LLEITTNDQSLTLTDKMQFYAPKWHKYPACNVGDVRELVLDDLFD